MQCLQKVDLHHSEQIHSFYPRVAVDAPKHYAWQVKHSSHFRPGEVAGVDYVALMGRTGDYEGQTLDFDFAI